MQEVFKMPFYSNGLVLKILGVALATQHVLAMKHVAIIASQLQKAAVVRKIVESARSFQKPALDINTEREQNKKLLSADVIDGLGKYMHSKACTEDAFAYVACLDLRAELFEKKEQKK
jgi:hypothetical protein